MATSRDEFLAAPRVAVISTTGPMGRIHAVPVWYRWDGDAFRILVGRGSQKHKNIERTGRATLCIDQREGMNYRYVTAEGPVVVEDTVTHAMEIDLWSHYVGERAEAAMKAAGSDAAKNVCLVLRPDSWIAPDRV